jgi:predicted transcriptional regulator
MSPRRAPRREAMGLYAFRLPDDLIGRVDAFARKLEKERPGMTVARADAVRALLTRGLDIDAQASGKKPRGDG